MNKIIRYTAVAWVLVAGYSCDGALEDELFEKNVLLTKNGWIEQTLETTSSGKSVIPLVVSINGTTENDKTVNVTVNRDSDNLAGYNFDKYRNQTHLYYTEVPSAAITLDTVLTIPSKDIRGISSVTIDMNQLENRYADYVLPLRIKNTSYYGISEDYSRVLYHIVPKNKYSGNYSGEISVFKTRPTTTGVVGTNTTDEMKVTTEALYALSDTECYFYAGQFDRTSADREKFIVTIDFAEDGTITMGSPYPDLELKLEEASMELKREKIQTDNRYETVETVLSLTYTFRDLTVPENLTKVILRAQAKISMRQDVFINN
jgi:hypothetical protein